MKTCFISTSMFLQNATHHIVRGTQVDGPNAVGLIVWAFIWGVALRQVSPAGDAIINLFTYLNAKLKDLVELILWYLPFGMVSLIAVSVLDIEDTESLPKLVLFVITVILGLILQTSLLLLIFWFKTNRNPFSLVSRVAPALFTALFISSSAATLPVTMHLCESGLHINKAVSRMILPLGTNTNKNGTAVYEVVAVLFISQLNSVEFNPSELFILCLIAAITSVGAPSIPALGAVSTMMVLTSVGLETGDTVLLLPVEWILDRLNTMVNVLGDIVCAYLIDHMMLQDEPGEQDPDINDNESGEEEGAKVMNVNSDPEHGDEMA
uniref:Amino acid transporter n=1 Tax=Neogobius melanostomus TaxID=47308 RepID=A0A8C6WQ30_9GOBI